MKDLAVSIDSTDRLTAEETRARESQGGKCNRERGFERCVESRKGIEERGPPLHRLLRISQL